MSGAISAAVQAGGKSARMGTDKAFVLLNDKPLIAHVLERVRQAGPDELFIIANNPERYGRLGAAVYADRIAGRGPLAGICTALEIARHPNVLVVACDMPFVSPKLLAYMVQLQVAARPAYDAVAPRRAGQIQGLPALYHKTCRPAIHAHLAADRLRLADLLLALNTRCVDEDEYEALGVSPQAFANINTPAELRQAHQYTS